MLELGPVGGEVADLVRLAVVPPLVWAAWMDWRTRRVTNRLWPPLVLVGLVALLLEAWVAMDAGGAAWREFSTVVVASLLLVLPLAYLFWYLGAFGGADAKAVMVLAVVYPTVPRYVVGDATFPAIEPAAGLFALSVLTNAAIFAMVYPLVLAVLNAGKGRFTPAMLVGRPVSPERVSLLPGRLIESPDGFDLRGLDLDALRMYLAWRNCSISDLRDDPERFRTELPTAPGEPGDGAIADGGSTEDPWGAAAFIDDLGTEPYGTDADTLRGGLEVLTARERVWYSPGIPFVVLLTLGLVVALSAGDVYTAVLDAVGLV